MTSLEQWLNKSIEERKLVACRLAEKFPNRVPIIIDSYDDNLVLDKRKYLVPYDLTIGHFISVLRKRLKMKEDKSIFMFILDESHSPSFFRNNFKNRFRIIPPCSEPIVNLVSKDKHLYALVGFENTFGVGT